MIRNWSHTRRCFVCSSTAVMDTSEVHRFDVKPIEMTTFNLPHANRRRFRPDKAGAARGDVTTDHIRLNRSYAFCPEYLRPDGSCGRKPEPQRLAHYRSCIPRTRASICNDGPDRMGVSDPNGSRRLAMSR